MKKLFVVKQIGKVTGFLCLCAIVTFMISGPAYSADWIAYNDVVYDTGLNGAGTDPNGQSVHYKHQYSTAFGIGTPQVADTVDGYSASSGELLNISNGSGTGITATLTENGSVNWQPQVADGTWHGGYDTAVGTDAYNTFNGFADMTGLVYYGTAGWYVDVEFTGLDPNKTYVFATSASRAKKNTEGAPGYDNRLTIYTISGVDSATNGSTTGTQEYQSDPYRVFFNTGNNHDEGYVARWTEINPGSDGTFKVRAEAHPDSEDSGRKASSFDVFILQQDDTMCTDVELLSDNFKGSPWDANWTGDWELNLLWGHDNPLWPCIPVVGCASASGTTSDSYFQTVDYDTENAESISIDFWYYTENSIDSGDFLLACHGTGGNVVIADLDDGAADSTWIHYTTEITDPQFFVSDFRLVFLSDLETEWFEDEKVTVDDVVIDACISDPDPVCTVPSLVCLPVCPTVIAEGLGCNVSYQHDDDVTEDCVISQNPDAGSAVFCGSNVDVVVSLGPPVVPCVAGEVEATGCSMIEDVSLNCVVSYVCSDTVSAGTIIDLSPICGTEVTVGSDVTIQVSTGPCMCDVPDVVGSTEASACDAIENENLICGDVSYACSDTVPEGNVVSQNPTSPGQLQCDVGVVNIVVSEGLPECPADINNDGSVNVDDFDLLDLEFGKTGCGTCNNADIDNDNDVDGTDLSILAAAIISGCPSCP